MIEKEKLFSSFKILVSEGYLKVTPNSFGKKKDNAGKEEKTIAEDGEFLNWILGIKKGSYLSIEDFSIKEGETSPPKRYTSGSMILAMENADSLSKMRSCVHRLREAVSEPALPEQRF